MNRRLAIAIVLSISAAFAVVPSLVLPEDEWTQDEVVVVALNARIQLPGGTYLVERVESAVGSAPADQPLRAIRLLEVPQANLLSEPLELELNGGVEPPWVFGLRDASEVQFVGDEPVETEFAVTRQAVDHLREIVLYRMVSLGLLVAAVGLFLVGRKRRE